MNCTNQRYPGQEAQLALDAPELTIRLMLGAIQFVPSFYSSTTCGQQYAIST